MRREFGSVLALAFVTAATMAACGQKNQAANAASETAGAENAPAATAPAGTTAAATGEAQQVSIPPNLPAGVTAAMIQQGDSIFHGPGNCYTCHGADAKGTALAPDLTTSTHIWVTDYPSYVKLVTDGVPQPKKHPAPMPPKGGSEITAQQVRAVAAYEWSLSHPQGGQ